MNILTEAHGGHRERLRQRVLDVGLDGMDPHEAIEYLLCFVIPRQDVNEIAHALLDAFGSLEGVLRAEVPLLAAVKGMGKHAAVWLALAGELMLAYMDLAEQEEECGRIRNFLDLYRCACRLEREIAPPCTLQLCLDYDGHIIHRSSIPSRAWGEPMYLQGLISDVLHSGASSVVLLQFTGKEAAEPEEYDISRACAYFDTLQAAGCALLDVVLAGFAETTSMRQRALIPEADMGEIARQFQEDYLRDMPDLSGLCLKEFGGAI
ncbi:MAG: hypothetical protein IJ466_01410 [Clostridia bacterium]|nr:hypothetical protein [Clostridia bacterium]